MVNFVVQNTCLASSCFGPDHVSFSRATVGLLITAGLLSNRVARAVSHCLRCVGLPTSPYNVGARFCVVCRSVCRPKVAGRDVELLVVIFDCFPHGRASLRVVKGKKREKKTENQLLRELR